MHIAIITPDYPFKNSYSYSFVKQLTEAMADLGHRISVIVPKSSSRFYMKCKRPWPYRLIETTKNGSSIHVYRLRVFGLGKLKIGNINLTEYLKEKAINKTLFKIHKEHSIDVLYGHFWRSANSARLFANKHHLPLFLANGESSLPLCNYGNDFFKALKGVICVSSKCREESVESGYLREGTPCTIIPNAVDSHLFYKMNKHQMRKEFAFNQEDFIVAFAGHFIERKGANRVSSAIQHINDRTIRSIFLGSYVGEDKSFGPSCDGILYQGGCAHKDVAKYLACADVFCLPTLNEGCCNAIVEAMACGLPIISSNLSFNWDILDSNNSILVNPMNVKEIANAILMLKNDVNLRNSMSQSSLEKSRDLKIENRAKKIISFIDNNK